MLNRDRIRFRDLVVVLVPALPELRMLLDDIRPGLVADAIPVGGNVTYRIIVNQVVRHALSNGWASELLEMLAGKFAGSAKDLLELRGRVDEPEANPDVEDPDPGRQLVALRARFERTPKDSRIPSELEWLLDPVRNTLTREEFLDAKDLKQALENAVEKAPEKPVVPSRSRLLMVLLPLIGVAVIVGTVLIIKEWRGLVVNPDGGGPEPIPVTDTTPDPITPIDIQDTPPDTKEKHVPPNKVLCCWEGGILISKGCSRSCPAGLRLTTDDQAQQSDDAKTLNCGVVVACVE